MYWVFNNVIIINECLKEKSEETNVFADIVQLRWRYASLSLSLFPFTLYLSLIAFVCSIFRWWWNNTASSSAQFVLDQFRWQYVQYAHWISRTGNERRDVELRGMTN